jgi:hypothetical protein
MVDGESGRRRVQSEVELDRWAERLDTLREELPIR